MCDPFYKKLTKVSEFKSASLIELQGHFIRCYCIAERGNNAYGRQKRIYWAAKEALIKELRRRGYYSEPEIDQIFNDALAVAKLELAYG
jgi:hypothetical protein